MDAASISIEASNLCKRFGNRTAISDLTFSIPQGEIVGFLGPNGAGKSTTLRILTGILPADSGFVSVQGIPVATRSDEVRRHIGYMPENNPLPEEMRVHEYLRFRARIKGIPRRKRRAEVEKVMEVCELQRKTRRRIIGTLSKGFRQRVGIADAILGCPPVTILDEPTIGLDPHQVLAIRSLLSQLRGETTVIFSSHILAEVEISCDRVLILNSGALVASGTADELREEFLPGTRFRCEIVAERERVDQRLRELGPGWEADITETEEESTFRVDLRNRENGRKSEDVLDALLAGGNLRVRAFRRLDPNLEEIFLTATRRSWDLSLKEEAGK